MVVAERTPTTDGVAFELESDPVVWVYTLFPRYVCTPDGVPIPMSQRHFDHWLWWWSLERGVRPRPFVGIWPRRGAKSTTGEMGVVSAGARKTRRYVLYVCETQDQADDHVSNIASMMESDLIGEFYPHMAVRMVGKYGNSKGWRRNRIRCSDGFTVDGIGLDVARRGVKLEEMRPDCMVFDDIDGELDSLGAANRKKKIITQKLLPAGSNDLAGIGLQNLVHTDSVFAQLNDGRADFWRGRVMSGPYVAVEGLEYELRDNLYVITAGRATWPGHPIEACQEDINDWGPTSFLVECQHEVELIDGEMFSHLEWIHEIPTQVPDLEWITVAVDPAVTDTDQSDAHGVQIGGLDSDGVIHMLFSWEQRASPEAAIALALTRGLEFGADTILVETNQGGDTWKSVVSTVWSRLHPGRRCPMKFRSAVASTGMGSKVNRASQMLTDYEGAKVRHRLGTHQALERALRRFPKVKPLDLVDAAFWCWFDLSRKRRKKLAMPQGMTGESRWVAPQTV